MEPHLNGVNELFIQAEVGFKLIKQQRTDDIKYA